MMPKTKNLESMAGVDVDGPSKAQKLELTELKEELEEQRQLVAFWKNIRLLVCQTNWPKLACSLQSKPIETPFWRRTSASMCFHLKFLFTFVFPICFVSWSHRCAIKLQQLQNQLCQEKNLKKPDVALSDNLNVEQTPQVGILVPISFFSLRK